MASLTASPRPGNEVNGDDQDVKGVKLPNNTQALAFTIDHVLTVEECEELIEKTEMMGYEEALLNVGGGRQILAPDVRKGYRCIWDSPEMADMFFQRIKKYLPEYWLGHKMLGLNERLRFLRYDPGEYFAPHFDGSYVRDNGERSYITVHLYLNEGYEGGTTTFLDNRGISENDVKVTSTTGSALIFQHPILHQGSEVTKGRKYTVRTDVMYAPEVDKAHLKDSELYINKYS